jgi:GH15 family glucan-1,4-alpha-glucosidase
MAKRIEDYAMISDCHSAALINKEGSIDWLAFPSFDSAACFASLLGNNENGRWSINPVGRYSVRRKYIEGTMVLETIFEGKSGSCKLVDCMVMGEKNPTLVRTVEGLTGSIELNLELIIRFDYGSIVPWVRMNEEGNGIHAIGGPEGIVLYSPVKLEGKDLHTVSTFTVTPQKKLHFSLTWYNSHQKRPECISSIETSVYQTIDTWRSWSRKCNYHGFDENSVKRSMLTLKALTYEPTGAIVAAPTTSLPEELGGERNWDYRYGWLRDSSFTLYALLHGGYKEEAIRWKEWLVRAVAGTPSQVNIMYGIRAERRLTEIELPWLSGYENSRPVRIGNAAYNQFQLDVFGEVLSTSLLGMKFGIPSNDNSWRIEEHMVDYVCDHWQEPDEGIWEVRGPKQHFTHSKFMAWVALNSAIEAIENYGMYGDIERWKILRGKIHKDICDNGFNQKLNSFVQSYGSSEYDASLLMMGHYKFLPPDDPRMIGTVDAIIKNLTDGSHVRRYETKSSIDGLRGTEGSFIACSFWLLDNLRMMGRCEEARERYFDLQKIKNDVGLYAEEYSFKDGRMVGNYPQAFSHIAEAISAMGFNDDRTVNCIENKLTGPTR